MMNEERMLQQRIQQSWILNVLHHVEDSGIWKTMALVRVIWNTHGNTLSGLASYTIDTRTDDEKKTILWVRNYSDLLWTERHATYHDAAVHQLNQTMRRYNLMAPFSARRILHDRRKFVDTALSYAQPLVIEAISARIRGLRCSEECARVSRQKNYNSFFSWLWN